MGRPGEARIHDLVRRHSSFSSIAALGRAIGDEYLSRKLLRARHGRYLPDTELLDKMAEHLDEVGRALLVDTLARDARLPGYDDELAVEQQQLITAIQALDARKREAIMRTIELLADPVDPPRKETTNGHRHGSRRPLR